FLAEEALALPAVELIGAAADEHELLAAGRYQVLDQLTHPLAVVVHDRRHTQARDPVADQRHGVTRGDGGTQRLVAQNVGEDQRPERAGRQPGHFPRLRHLRRQFGDPEAVAGRCDDLQRTADDAALEDAATVVGEQAQLGAHGVRSSSSAWTTSATAPMAPSWSEYARLSATSAS